MLADQRRRNHRQLICNRWELDLNHKLGSGAFADVYRGSDADGNVVAVKMEKASIEKATLPHESDMYMVLQSGLIRSAGIPCVEYGGKHAGRDVLVMECLGISVWKCMLRSGGKLSSKSIFTLIIQALETLEYIHSRGIIHCDLKPSNFVMGRLDADKLYVVDYGLARSYRHQKTTRHLRRRKNYAGDGTTDFMSREMMLGYTPSRRDDLESLVYTMVYLRHGSLPWTHIVGATRKKERRAVHDAKEGTSIHELSSGFPRVMRDFVEHVWGLNFEQKPDYSRFKKLFYESLTESYSLDETVYDWLPGVTLSAVARRVATS